MRVMAVVALLILLVQGTVSARQAVTDGTFVRDPDGAVWIVLEGRRVRVPIRPLSDEEIGAIPGGDEWLIPSGDGGVIVGGRPSWADAAVAAGGGIGSTTFDGLTVTVLRVERGWRPDHGLFVPKSGMEYVTVEVRFDTRAEGLNRYDGTAFQLDTEDGARWGWTVGRTPDLTGGPVLDGRPVRGWLTFEVPLGAPLLQLVWQAHRDYALVIALP